MKFAKLISLVLAVLMITLAAVACGGNDDTTAAPDTTKAPDNTTKAPDNTTKAPDNTTKAPDNTTKAPDNTTKAPDNTTKAPETTPTPGGDVTPSDDKVKVDQSAVTITDSGDPGMTFYASYPLTNMFDGDTTTRFASAGQSKAPTAQADGYWFVIDFGKEVTFDYLLDVDFKQAWTAMAFAISADGTTFTDVDASKITIVSTPAEAANTVNVEFTFAEPITTRYLKMTATNSETGLAGNSTFSIWELEFYKLAEASQGGEETGRPVPPAGELIDLSTATLTATSQVSHGPAESLRDGDLATYWQTTSGDFNDDGVASFQLDFSDTISFSSFVFVIPDPDKGRISTIKVEVSADGTAWTELVPATAIAEMTGVEFEQHIEFVFTSGNQTSDVEKCYTISGLAGAGKSVKVTLANAEGNTHMKLSQVYLVK